MKTWWLIKNELHGHENSITVHKWLPFVVGCDAHHDRPKRKSWHNNHQMRHQSKEHSNGLGYWGFGLLDMSEGGGEYWPPPPASGIKGGYWDPISCNTSTEQVSPHPHIAGSMVLNTILIPIFYTMQMVRDSWHSLSRMKCGWKKRNNHLNSYFWIIWFRK